MSRIAKMPIPVPSGLEVSLGSGEIRVKGPKGELAMRLHPVVEIAHEGGEVTCSAREGGYGFTGAMLEPRDP